MRKKKKVNKWDEGQEIAKKMPELSKERKQFIMREMETIFGKLDFTKPKK